MIPLVTKNVDDYTVWNNISLQVRLETMYGGRKTYNEYDFW